LHLIEPLLTVARRDPEVRLVEIEIHQALLDVAGDANFWEAGWLRHRMQRASLAVARAESAAAADPDPLPSASS